MISTARCTYRGCTFLAGAPDGMCPLHTASDAAPKASPLYRCDVCAVGAGNYRCGGCGAWLCASCRIVERGRMRCPRCIDGARARPGLRLVRT